MRQVKSTLPRADADEEQRSVLIAGIIERKIMNSIATCA